MVAGVLRYSPSVAPRSVITGGVRSSVKWTETALWFPARSCALTTSVCAPSAATGVPLAKGAPSSVALTLAR